MGLGLEDVIGLEKQSLCKRFDENKAAASRDSWILRTQYPKHISKARALLLNRRLQPQSFVLNMLLSASRSFRVQLVILGFRIWVLEV